MSYFSISVSNVLLLSGFLDLFAVSMVVTQFPAHLKELGWSSSKIGLISSIYGGVQLFSSPIAGRCADVWGARRALLMCLLMSTIGYALLAVDTASLWLILCARIVTGLFKHSQTLNRAHQTRLKSSGSMEKVQGRFNAISSCGFILGPPAGGHLMQHLAGFSGLAYCTATFFLLQTVLLLLFVPELQSSAADQPRVDSKRSAFRSYISQIEEVDWTCSGRVFLCRMLMTFAILVFRSQSSLQLKEQFDLTASQIGYVTSLGACASVLCSLNAHHVCALLGGRWHALRISMVLTFLAVLGMSHASSVFMYVVCLVPMGLGAGIGRVLFTTLILESGGPEQAGSLLGLSASSLSFARLVSPAAGGFLLDLGPTAPGLVGASAALVALLLAGPSKRKLR